MIVSDFTFFENKIFDLIIIGGYPALMIFWNFALLIIPFIIAKKISYYQKNNKFSKNIYKIFGVFLFFVWLIFIPNSAYIITDVRHVVGSCGNFNWYRVCPEKSWVLLFFFTYALAGWLFFVLLIKQMKDNILNLFGKSIKNLFILLLMPFVSLGVLLGLINRWNSWEVFTNPLKILYSISVYFTDPIFFKNWFFSTLFLFILFFIGNFFIRSEIQKSSESYKNFFIGIFADRRKK